MSKESNSSAFGTNPFKAFNATGFDFETILNQTRRNMELVNATQQVLAETTKAIFKIQTQFMRESLEQLSEQTKQNFSASPLEEKMEQSSKTARKSLEKTIDSAREMNALISKSNDEIISSVQKRINEAGDISGKKK